MRSRYSASIFCVLLIVATLAVYWPVLNHDFVIYDDRDYVTENPHIQGGIIRANGFWALTTFHAGNWHPLTWLSHMLDYQLFGLKAGMHHLTSLLFHMANSILLFFVLRRMTGAIWRSGFVAALFALHPLHVESVAWISERKDVLSAFFWMLTILAYVRYTERPGFNRYLLVLIFFTLGLMSKPMVVTLPFVLLLMDFWPLCRVQWGQLCEENSAGFQKVQALRLVWEKIPLFALVLFSCVMTFLSEQGANTVGSLDIYPFSMRVSNALVSYLTYIRKMFWPGDLAVLYPYPGAITWWQTLGAGALLVCLFVLALRASRRSPYLVVGWLWYLGTLVPVIGLVQVGVQGMADRYTYIPIIGLFMMVAWGFHDLLGRRRHARVVLSISAGLLLSTLMICTWFQVRHWINSIALFTHTVNVTSDNYMGHHILGVAFEKKGRLNDALAHYFESIKIEPHNCPDSYSNIGGILVQQGRIEDAIKYCSEALRIDPASANAHIALGNALAAKGDTDAAVGHFLEALKIKPESAEAHNNLGNIFFRQGRIEDAIQHCSRALKVKARFVKAHINLANALAFQGRYKAAIEHYSKALEIKPDSADALNNLGITQARQGRIASAIKHFSDAIKIRPDFAKAHVNLGDALVLQGNLKEGGSHFREALRINPKNASVRHKLDRTLRLQGKQSGASNNVEVQGKM